MARSNVDAIYAENPFLSKLISRVKVPDAQVKRWSEKFLASTPDTYPDSGTENIYFLDQRGDTIARVGSLSDRIAGFFGFHRNSETVGQALARMGDETRKLKYAVGVWNGRVILWKLPNGYDNAADWLAPMVAKAQRLMTKASGYEGILLPITNDHVVMHYVNGVSVRSRGSRYEVVVSTPAKEYIVPCSTMDEAETVRDNIVEAGDVLKRSGGY